MSKIINIGVLDVRNISEELAEKVTSMENIGALIESSESQGLLKDCAKINIGKSIKIPKDSEVNLLTQNGDLMVDRDFLEGLLKPVVITVNGQLIISENVDAALLDEKVYYMLVNGQIICTRKLSGIVHSKAMVNGKLIKYSSDYKFLTGNVKLANSFLKSIKPNSKLAFEVLTVLEDFDMKLFEEKISNIDVQDKLILVDEYEESISCYIDDYYQVEKIIIPKGSRETKYVDDNIKIDDSSIKKFDHASLYVDGEVEIYLNENVVFNDYIEHLICDKVTCNEKTYEIVKNSLDDDVEIEIVKGKLLKNTGKITLSGDVEEETTIINMGKLVVEETLNIDKFNENVVYIINYGLITAPEDKLNIVKNKIRDNFGKIRTPIEQNAVNKEEDDDVLYANMGELRL